jgi:putative IMPACT (imprinted ancient) family translation regulator
MAEHTQWEYRVQTFGTFFTGMKDEEMEEALNEWGVDGWEVISARGIENTSKVVVLAKRPLTASARRRHSFPV